MKYFKYSEKCKEYHVLTIFLKIFPRGNFEKVDFSFCLDYISTFVKLRHKKKCAILKIQKENPNHNNLQIILTWWWPDTPETSHRRGNSNFPHLLSDKFSLFLFSRNDTAQCPVPRGLSQLGHLTTARRKTQSLFLSLENRGQDRSSRSVRSLGPARLGSIHQIALGSSHLHSSDFRAFFH